MSLNYKNTNKGKDCEMLNVKIFKLVVTIYAFKQKLLLHTEHSL